MKKYAIAIADTKGNIGVEIIESEFSDDAVIQAVINRFKWDMRNEDAYAEVETLSDLINFALQSEILVSEPVEI